MRGPVPGHLGLPAAGLLYATAPANTTSMLLPGETLVAAGMITEVAMEEVITAPSKTTLVHSEERLTAPAMALLDPMSPRHLLVAPARVALGWPAPAVSQVARLMAPASALAAVPAAAMQAATPPARPSAAPAVFMATGSLVFLWQA